MLQPVAELLWPYRVPLEGAWHASNRRSRPRNDCVLPAHSFGFKLWRHTELTEEIIKQEGVDNDEMSEVVVAIAECQKFVIGEACGHSEDYNKIQPC